MSSILDASKDISSCANLLSVILTFRSSGLIESSSLARALRGAPTRLHSSSRCCENPSKTVRVAPSNFLRTRSSRSRNCARLSASADKSPPDVEAPSRARGYPKPIRVSRNGRVRKSIQRQEDAGRRFPPSCGRACLDVGTRFIGRARRERSSISRSAILHQALR